MSDPGRDAIAALARRAWQEGYAQGLKQRLAAACIRCALAGALLAISVIWAVAMAQTIPRAADQYRYSLTKISQSVWGMNAPIPALAAQLMVESGFRPGITSGVGAGGIAQFMPATAADLARRYPQLQPVNVFSPDWAIRAQSLLMRDLVKTYSAQGRDPCNCYCYALSAYNGGPRWVNTRITMSSRPQVCWVTQQINPGIRASAQQENRLYPIKVLLDWEPIFESAGWGQALCPTYSRNQGEIK